MRQYAVVVSMRVFVEARDILDAGAQAMDIVNQITDESVVSRCVTEVRDR